MSDDELYKPSKARLHNNFMLGWDEYPKDIPDATKLFKNFNHKGPKLPKKKNPKCVPHKPGRAYVQPAGNPRNGNWCAICRSTNHHGKQCIVVSKSIRKSLIVRLIFTDGSLWPATNTVNQSQELEKLESSLRTVNANTAASKANVPDDDDM